MHLHSYRLTNFRRFHDALIELASDISIFVGSNNSGKTSATQAVIMFLSGDRKRFSMFDFSSPTWRRFNECGDAAPEVEAGPLPTIAIDLWFEVSEDDLYLALPILPSSAWSGSLVGVRIEFAATNSTETLARFRAKKLAAVERAAGFAGGAGNYTPWPKSMTDYLQKELANEYELKYYVLDRAQYSELLTPFAGYLPAPLAGELKGPGVLRSLVRVDCLNAQRHLADGQTARAEDLSHRLSRYYQHNLMQREEDHGTLKALFDSEEGFNEHLKGVFGKTLARIARLGYPGMHNPRLEIRSELNPASVMSQDARVHYIVGEGDDAVRLPDSYNGLGFKNLIYMVVEILDLHSRWEAEEGNRPPLHLIFIEEPEAHLHAQLQQVFVRNVLDLVNGEDATSLFSSQIVVTTHSPHITYERGFKPIRYFRRHLNGAAQRTEVLNLSRFQPGDAPKDRDFLQRYLKLTHCDLFFADAAILVEGNVERLLMPLMIEKEARSLRSAALCILEVGGAFGHRFKELIEFLGITTLVVTDIDSVTDAGEPGEDLGDEDEDIEFELPAEEEGAAPRKRFGKSCLPSTENAVTSNQTLIQWLPKIRGITELLDAGVDSKIQDLPNSAPAQVRVAYQVKADVDWQGSTVQLCGRTLEESFGLENAKWSQAAEQKAVGLKLKNLPQNAEALAAGLNKRVTGKGFDKTKFALQVLSADKDSWVVPQYIREGLAWLKFQIDLKVGQEVEVLAEAQVEKAVVPDIGVQP